MQAGLTVLHVEDDEVDARMTKHALRQHDQFTEIHRVIDGHQALAFLKKKAPFESAPTPGLVLMDYHLPGLKADEVLERIQIDTTLQHLPIIILSGEDDPKAILNSYRLGARAYVRKPDSAEGYVPIAKSIRDFWLQIAQLPTIPFEN